MFFSHAAGAWVIGHVTYGWAVVFVASAIADFIVLFREKPLACLVSSSFY